MMDAIIPKIILDYIDTKVGEVICEEYMLDKIYVDVKRLSWAGLHIYDVTLVFMSYMTVSFESWTQPGVWVEEMESDNAWEDYRVITNSDDTAILSCEELN